MIRDILLLNKIRKDPLQYFEALGREAGHKWFSILGSPVLFLNDATAIEYVFSQDNKNYHRGKYNEGLRPLLGDSVFIAEGEKWRAQRRDAAPVFSAAHFQDFEQRMREAIAAMTARWQNGQVIDLHAETMRLALDVVLRALFHETSDAALGNARTAFGTMLRLAETRIWQPLSLPLPLALKRPKYKRTLALLDGLTRAIIDARKENGTYPEDLLSRLLAAEDDRTVHDNVRAFMLGAHETTGNALAWTFHLLAQNDAARTKVLQESGNTPLNMPYTRKVFAEALRLYPPVWTMSRRALGADTVPLEDGSNVRIKKDDTIMLCAYAVHRRPAYWRNPAAFDPERFDNDNRAKFAYFPFGGGARLCLGFKFAELEAVLALSMVYSHFHLELLPDQGIRPEPLITLRPDRPMLFRVQKR